VDPFHFQYILFHDHHSFLFVGRRPGRSRAADEEENVLEGWQDTYLLLAASTSQSGAST